MTRDWIARRIEREARRRPGSLGALAGAVALLAMVAGGAVLGTRAGRALVPVLERNVHVIAYVDDGLGSAERARLLVALQRIPGVERARLVEPEEALGQLRAAADSLGGAAAVAGVEAGFLPRSVEIAVAGGPDLSARTNQLAVRLRTLPGVIEVDAMNDGLARLESWLLLGRGLGLLTLVIAVLAGVAALALAVFAGRERRRREAEVLALLGETAGGIRQTASIAGAVAALTGAVAGLVLLTALFPAALRAMEAAVGLGPLAVKPTLGGLEVLIGTATALAVGWFGGRLGTPAGEVAEGGA